MGDISKALERIGARDLTGAGMTQGTRPPFEPKPAQGAKPPAVGKSKSGGGKSSGGGNNLVELSYATREYYDERSIFSSDGTISMRVRPIKAIVLTNGQRLEFKEPPP